MYIVEQQNELTRQSAVLLILFKTQMMKVIIILLNVTNPHYQKISIHKTINYH